MSIAERLLFRAKLQVNREDKDRQIVISTNQDNARSLNPTYSISEGLEGTCWEDLSFKLNLQFEHILASFSSLFPHFGQKFTAI